MDHWITFFSNRWTPTTSIHQLDMCFVCHDPPEVYAKPAIFRDCTINELNPLTWLPLNDTILFNEVSWSILKFCPSQDGFKSKFGPLGLMQQKWPSGAFQCSITVLESYAHATLKSITFHSYLGLGVNIHYLNYIHVCVCVIWYV